MVTISSTTTIASKPLKSSRNFLIITSKQDGCLPTWERLIWKLSDIKMLLSFMKKPLRENLIAWKVLSIIQAVCGT